MTSSRVTREITVTAGRAASGVGAALERLAEPAPHLRWRLAAPGEPLLEGELSCATLAADPDALAAAVAASAAGRGSEEPQVLASLWWQAYAYRVAGTALACWLLSDIAPDVRADAMAVGIARSRPTSVAYLVPDPAPTAPTAPTAAVPGSPGTPGTRGDDSRPGVLEAMASGPRTSSPRDCATGSHCLGTPARGTDAVAELVDRLFAGHLDQVAASLRARHRIGRLLVWGNVAAACASAAGAVREATGPSWRERLDAFLLAAPHDLADYGSWSAPVGVGTASNAGPAVRNIDDPTAVADDGATGCDPVYRRTTCCLWWKTSVADGALCADCSLARSPIETPTA